MDKLLLNFPLELAEAGSEELPRNFSGVAYSGGHVPSYDVVVDLSSTSLDADMPLLNSHGGSVDDVIGSIAQSINDGTKITIAGTLFSDIEPAAQRIAQKAQAGAKFQLSVGLYDGEIHRLSKGQKETINGHEFSGPTSILKGATVRETSVVPLGADPQTSSSFFSQNQNSEETDMELQEALDTINQLKAELSEATDKAKAAEAELESQKKAQHEDRVKAMFGAMGIEFSDEAAKPYNGMSAQAIESITAKFSETTQKQQDELTSEVLLSGGSDGDDGSLTAFVAKSHASN